VLPQGPVRSVLRRMNPRFQPGIDGEMDATNYYEGLINEGGRSERDGLLTQHWLFASQSFLRAESRLMMGTGHPFTEECCPAAPEYAPNRLVESPAGPIRTNALGMVDREYSAEKPPGTWRILMFGDSLGRALGVPQGKGLEPLLEEWLNDAAVNTAGRHVEILNLSTSGHRVIRSLDYAIRKGPSLSADVFILELSRRDLPPGWASEISNFARKGIEPPYPFIRDLIRLAGVTRTDTREKAIAKLDATFVEGMRRVLTEFKEISAAHKAEPVVLLLPIADPPGLQSPQFDPLRVILKDLNYLVVDLIDAFGDVPDPSRLGIDAGDDHPNEEGQAILFARLKEELARRPDILNVLRGPVRANVRKP
jgi:lysophospholipase L1-like esterase